MGNTNGLEDLATNPPLDKAKGSAKKYTELK